MHLRMPVRSRCPSHRSGCAVVVLSPVPYLFSKNAFPSTSLVTGHTDSFALLPSAPTYPAARPPSFLPTLPAPTRLPTPTPIHLPSYQMHARMQKRMQTCTGLARNWPRRSHSYRYICRVIVTDGDVDSADANPCR